MNWEKNMYTYMRITALDKTGTIIFYGTLHGGLRQLHQSVNYSFLVAGHTKFAPLMFWDAQEILQGQFHFITV